MGTRHQQKVITKAGKLKVNQYGQWDGYPSGQGIGILTYLRNGNLEKYQEELEKIEQITDEQVDMVNADEDWKTNYPYMSRDCGANIHQMIEDGKVKFVNHINDDEARQWCEGFYTIDFEKGLFISEYWGRKSEFPLNNLPTDEAYREAMKPKEE